MLSMLMEPYISKIFSIQALVDSKAMGVKIAESGLSFFLIFIFFSIYFSIVSIFRTLGLGFKSDQLHCHISHI